MFNHFDFLLNKKSIFVKKNDCFSYWSYRFNRKGIG